MICYKLLTTLDYCMVYLKENIECSHRDYDDYFYHAKREIQDFLDLEF